MQTSSSTHPMSSHVKVPQPHGNDIQICLNSGNFLCHSDVQGFFSLKPHKAVLRTFPKIMRVSLAPSAALQPSSKCVTSYETSICTVCSMHLKDKELRGNSFINISMTKPIAMSIKRQSYLVRRGIAAEAKKALLARSCQPQNRTGSIPCTLATGCFQKHGCEETTP